MINAELKNKIAGCDFTLKEIADEVGVSEYTLMGWFNHVLTDSKRTQIEDAIDRLESMRAVI